MKELSVIKTHDMVLQERAARRKEREDRMKEAQARKRRMRELEAEGKKHRVKTELEIIKEMEDARAIGQRVQTAGPAGGPRQEHEPHGGVRAVRHCPRQAARG